MSSILWKLESSKFIFESSIQRRIISKSVSNEFFCYTCICLRPPEHRISKIKCNFIHSWAEYGYVGRMVKGLLILGVCRNWNKVQNHPTRDPSIGCEIHFRKPDLNTCSKVQNINVLLGLHMHDQRVRIILVYAECSLHLQSFGIFQRIERPLMEIVLLATDLSRWLF